MVTNLADIDWAIKELSGRARNYLIARDYYLGNHRLAFATEKFRNAFGALFQTFSDNLCPVVIETLHDRLKLDGFTGMADETVVADLWRRNRMKQRAGEVHLDALIEGDAYLIVWPDASDQVTFYPNRAAHIAIKYDEETPGIITRAAKWWMAETGQARLTLYYPDRIEKYETKNVAAGGLPDNARVFEVCEIDGESWPLVNPYGRVPVFHFGNRAGIGMLGRSELTEAIAIQDALNKSVADMLVAMEFYAVPQRYATGVEGDIDPETGRSRYPLLAGGVWATPSTDVKFGEFAANDLTQFIAVSEAFRKEMARVTRTPLHFFTLEGSFPSGESQKVAEAPLLSKVEDRQTSFGAVWADAMAFALRVAGKGELTPEPVWLDTAPRSDADIINNAAVMVEKLGLSQRQALRLYGYTDAEIDANNEEKRQETAPQPNNERADRGLLSPELVPVYSQLVKDGQLSTDTLWSMMEESFLLPEEFDPITERTRIIADATDADLNVSVETDEEVDDSTTEAIS